MADLEHAEKVSDGKFHPLNTIAEVSDAGIASVAQDSTHCPRLMAVIYVPGALAARLCRSTYRATTSLLLQQRIVLLARHAVLLLQLIASNAVLVLRVPRPNVRVLTLAIVDSPDSGVLAHALLAARRYGGLLLAAPVGDIRVELSPLFDLPTPAASLGESHRNIVLARGVMA